MAKQWAWGSPTQTRESSRLSHQAPGGPSWGYVGPGSLASVLVGSLSPGHQGLG